MADSAKEAKNTVQKKAADPGLLRLVPEAMARTYLVFPLSADGDVLRVAMADPTDIIAIEVLSSRSRMRIEPVPSSAEEILEAIDANYRAYDEIEKHISSISATEDEREKSRTQAAIDAATEAPVAQVLTLIIEEAVKARASDIHLEPGDDKMRVRLRIDGTLHEVFSLPLSMVSPLISRIKVLGNMNIADHHRPQDGQFSIKTKGRSVDIRVGIIATVYGE
ncbi:MAG: ATPase, T2SS/T4P/T4SS family, partial [Dehalococcoidales bacterium]|nr:ATPase, T2SS/T4P/T4SS family [Dehalococcoidales bacterium]